MAKTTITLTKEEIARALINFYVKDNVKADPKNVKFNIADVSDDRFRGGPNYSLISADIVIENT